MAVRILLYLGLIYLLLNVVKTEENIENVTCQLEKPLRKQIEAEPLNGRCLRDIVVQFAKALRTISNDELGVTIFQEMLDKQEFVNISNGPDVKLKNLVDKLDNQIKSYVELLRQSNSVIQQILLKHSSNNQQNQAFQLNFARNRVSIDEKFDICSQISTALSSNLRDQEWKNLHILPVSQPGTMCGPPSLAHNIGPLFLSQCNRSKHVILLLEHGMFMSEGDVTLAQITAKTVIDMLSETDYVTVVGLAGRGSVHCKNGLVKANDVNKFHLTRHVDTITRTDSNQTLDVDFKSLTGNLTGEVVIIHVTNMLKNTTNLKNITEEIYSQKLTAYLRTILILSDTQPHTNIKNISEDTITLPTQNVLGYEIAKLFVGLKCSSDERKDYYLSDPYFEPYTKGMMLSVGQITNVAVLSLDIKLKDFLEDVTYFNAGPNTHAILFDNNEIVWMHKNFPRMEMIAEQPLKVYLHNIENIDSETIQILLKESEGFKIIETKLGVKKQIHWKHLIYKDLIACVISENKDDFLPVAKTVPPLPSNILHHRLDLMLQSAISKDIFCLNHNRISTLSTGVVYLSPWCFQSPTEQLKLLETGSAVTVQSYMAYIKDLTRLLANPGLHSSVKPDIGTFAQILNHFKIRHNTSSLNKFIVRRYVVAAASGAMEIYPGIVLDSELDPKRRAWYGKALEYPGKIVLTSPYLDAGGSGYVITLSHTVYEGRSAALHSNNDPVIAVVSMDITLGYFSRILRDMFSFCNDSTVKCFLMDDKGYLVFHPSMLDPTSKIEQQHLTHKELLVANDILNHEFFVRKKSCASYLDGTVQRYYQFNTSLEEVLTNIVHGEHCIKYQVAAVPGTNVFLGVVNATCNLHRSFSFCPCSTMDRLCFNCKRMEQTECECPCECSLYSASCGQQNFSVLEPCPAPYEQGISSQLFWTQSVPLKSCPSFNCKDYQTENECLGIVNCQWCHYDSDGETPLQAPFCSDLSLCFRGIFGSLVPYGDGSYKTQSTEEIVAREWPSVGPVAGGILAFVLILGISLFCYRLRSVQSGLEHQCLHLHTSPDTLRMTNHEGDPEPMEMDQMKNNLDSLLREGIAPISPYRVSTNYRRPPGGDSDHGYSTMTPHDDSEQQTFVEPLLIVGGNTESDLVKQNSRPPSPMTHLGSPHHVLAPVTVHRHMEANFC
ncbi:VWFA and cache domain-containing protein 1 [Leptopilina boulardi]|uniref:VWFA and cache domain-containing protein 1 n=1 Tax=Leptopilina boulardi TaxID=63433 RepID=UPI0021F5FBF0|nr:VWFA and cache domain-containing protein 1 [Leptopilina boulardi]